MKVTTGIAFSDLPPHIQRLNPHLNPLNGKVKGELVKDLPVYLSKPLPPSNLPQPTQTSTKPRKRRPSEPEMAFKRLWQAHGQGLSLQAEYGFDKMRKWRSDFAYVQGKVLVEIEGAVWSQGRHTRGSGFIKDCEKYNTATIMGWVVIRLTPSMINRDWIEKIVGLCRRRTNESQS